jgi:predicted AlkP superfamily pyrophosphatase or phosphodiesterase
MPRHRWRSVLAAAALLLTLALGLAAVPPPPAGAPAAPSGPARLAVLVVFDQMRADYLTRWDALFGEGGFHRLEGEGAWFQNCHYPYSQTVTGAGHASLLTGCSPRTHGVVSNSWFDRDVGRTVYCAAGPRYRVVPPAPQGARERTPGELEEPPGGGSPERLLVPTLGDALKRATGGAGRVVSVSLKDRSAVLPAGRQPDACYWFDSGTGRFVTSTYYRDRAHPWVEALNTRRPANAWFGREWERVRPDLDYARYSGPDDAPGEGTGISGPGKRVVQGRVFPHPLRLGLPAPGRAYYDAVVCSPFGNDLLLELAEAAVDAYGLGSGPAPDLLSVSFSSNDIVGHAWGPDSQEVLDVTLRSDDIVRRLLEFLDRRVGRGRYVVALTADHGVCPLPEAARARGLDARRIPEPRFVKAAEDFLRETFGGAGTPAARCVERFQNDGFTLNPAWLRSAGLNAARVEEALADWLRRQPDVEAAFTRDQLSAPQPPDDPLAARVWRTFHPRRCGDVLVVMKPYRLWGGPLSTGTTHGSPHPYDTHVPLLVYGPGVRPGVRTDPVTPQACAAVLARGLGVPPPAACEAPVPDHLFGE